MVKDIVGNTVKEGDLIFVQGIVYTVKKIEDGRILSGSQIGNKMQGVMIPGKLICEAEFPFDSSKHINGFVIQRPNNQDIATGTMA